MLIDASDINTIPDDIEQKITESCPVKFVL